MKMINTTDQEIAFHSANLLCLPRSWIK